MAVIWLVVSCAAGLAVQVVMDRASTRNPVVGLWWYGFLTVLYCALFAADAVARWWGWAAAMAGFAGFAAWVWWKFWNKRKRKRAAALMGAKSRARIGALVRKAREAARPRRVLRPVPGATS